MIRSKRYFLLMVASCFFYLICLLIATKCGIFTSAGNQRGSLSESGGFGHPFSDVKSRNGVPPVIVDYRNSKLFRTHRENIRWNNRKILSNLIELIDSNHSAGIKFIPRYEEMKVVWFSMPDSWKEKPYPRLFTCDTGTVLLRKADLDPVKLGGADVVLFSRGFENKSLWRQLQATRDPRQVWLFNTDESPLTARTYIPPKSLRNITFNMTYTYRSDADISIPYGYYSKYRSAVDVKNHDYYKASPKVAAWVSDPCDSATSWNRTGFMWDLSRLLPIDKFGACGGNLTCGDTEKSCKALLRQYKFHFALENSCCTEYISDRFWNVSCYYDAIPIVVGAKRDDYERVAPPNSFIYAADFPSLEKLAKYIKEVAADPELFNSFFAWKAEGKVRRRSVNQRRVGMSGANCRILKYLQDPRLTLTKHDLHGPDWMGGCVECTEERLLRNYRTSG